MNATILDTQTGNTGTHSGPKTSEWVDGNWSCDCNRSRIFDVEKSTKGYCAGSHRFIVVAYEREDAEMDYDLSIGELNLFYPDDLLRHHGIEPSHA